MIRKFFRLLSILVLCAALFFGYQTLEWSNKYKQGHDEYEKLQAQNTPENESTPENDSDSTKELPFCPDWTALKAENPDIVGWIRMDPTCDYPIMQAQDNDYYLYKGFGRSYNINGSIFLSSVNSSDFRTKILLFMVITCGTEICLVIMIITMKNRIALSIPISGSIEKMDNTPIEFLMS